MSTYTSEPGTRLAGRYRLVDQTNAGTGWTYWKAVDETLARSVTVLTFAAGFDRTAETITAARAASRLSDPRFSQVFDVEDADDQAYVVMEWVVGESLLDMLADGPLDSPSAVSLVSEAARALAAAHATGLAHLRLSPACLHWTRGGGVKITGLGIDAALAGPAVISAEGGEDPELTDTRGLASLLYAALTGYWPGPRDSSPPAEPPAVLPSLSEGTHPPGPPSGETTPPEPPAVLPPAPEADGTPCTPRQVSAGVPANIDALTCQALFQRPSRHGPALSTPAMFADALASVAPPDPLPVPAAATTPIVRVPPPASPYPVADPAPLTQRAGSPRRPPGQRPPAAGVVISAVIVLVLVAAGVTGWALLHRGGHAGATPPAQRTTSSSSAQAAASSVVLKPVSANSFDAYGNDGGDEDGSQAKYAIDNDPTTFWHTSYYDTYPAFGNLKKGTGLILDMGEQVRLSQVVVQFGTSCCAHVQIEIGNTNDPVPSSLSTFTSVQSSTNAAGTTTFDVTSKATGRYVLIWITYLPPLAGSADRYEAQIYNVVVHGSSARQSG